MRKTFFLLLLIIFSLQIIYSCKKWKYCDLYIEYIYIEETDVSVNAPIQLNFSIGNKGGDSAIQSVACLNAFYRVNENNPWEIIRFSHGGESYTNSFSYTRALAEGETYALYINFNMNTPGQYLFRVEADFYQVNEELTRENNSSVSENICNQSDRSFLLINVKPSMNLNELKYSSNINEVFVEICD